MVISDQELDEAAAKLAAFMPRDKIMFNINHGDKWSSRAYRQRDFNTQHSASLLALIHRLALLRLPR